MATSMHWSQFWSIAEIVALIMALVTSAATSGYLIRRIIRELRKRRMPVNWSSLHIAIVQAQKRHTTTGGYDALADECLYHHVPFCPVCGQCRKCNPEHYLQLGKR